MGQIGGEPAEIVLRLRCKYSVQPLVEFFECQPAVCVMLPQFGGDSVALPLPYAQAWLRCHLPSVPLARSLIVKRYIASTQAATLRRAWPPRTCAPFGLAVLTLTEGAGANSGSSCCRRTAG